MPLTPVQKLAMSVGASLVVLGGFGAASFYFASRLATADRAVERANANMSSAFRIVVARQEGEHITKAYVVRPDSQTHHALKGVQTQVEDALDAMRRGTEDNPRQYQRVQALAEGAARNFEVFRTTVRLRDRVGADSARKFLTAETTVRAADSLMSIVEQIREEELRVLGEQTLLQSAHSASAQRLILIGMVLAFLAAGLVLQPMRQAVAHRITTHIVREHASGGGEISDRTPTTLPGDQ